MFSQLILEETDSTNNEAKRLVEAGAIGGPTAIRAFRQTSGRGSRGRSWVSYEGNVLATFVFETPSMQKDLPLLVYSISLAVFDTITMTCTDQVVSIKWPNDVLLNGFKVSGALHETATGPQGKFFIAGIGINVEHFPENNALIEASSLRHQNCVQKTAAEHFETLCESMTRRLKEFEQRKFTDIRDEVLDSSYGVGQEVRVSLTGSKEDAVRGTFVCIDDNGLMNIKRHDGELMKLSTGTIFTDLGG